MTPPPGHSWPLDVHFPDAPELAVLGPRPLHPIVLVGREALSELFEFDLTLLAPHRVAERLAFEQFLGKHAAVRLALPNGGARWLHGFCNQLTEGERDDAYVTFRLRLVPRPWLLTRRLRCRIFQGRTVPQILQEVFAGFDVAFQLQGDYQPRDYCVQYRENDFAFACRLMEDEGIWYYFRHTEGGHRLVVADTPPSHAEVPGPAEVLFDDRPDAFHVEDFVHTWRKQQLLRSAKYQLRDHCFELPDHDLAAEREGQESLRAGRVEHRLRLPVAERSVLDDWPGGYAARFDGVAPGGTDRSGDLPRIFEDGRRTVALRAQLETLPGLRIEGAGGVRHFSAGHRFGQIGHPHADGTPYVLTEVVHRAEQGREVSGDDPEFCYHNTFACIPLGLPFRPERRTPRPVVHGTQTAVVVGPPGEEIFTDKYGRVKVKFRWDRSPGRDAASSCWVRVATPWAGKGWGAVQVPRVGQEVVIAFEEGDPDQPLIVGSVYNADQTPPYALPENRTTSGVKTCSTPGGAIDEYNELRFEDRKGSECITLRAGRDCVRQVKRDERVTVGRDQEVVVTRGNRTVRIELGSSTTEALGAIELRVGENVLRIDQSGITLHGLRVRVEGAVKTHVLGLTTLVEGEGQLRLNGDPVRRKK